MAETLKRKLHGYQALLWLKQEYEEFHDVSFEASSTTQDVASSCSLIPTTCLSKSSVYDAYVTMCGREQRPIMFTRAVVGKMVRRAFPNVRTLRRGPRGSVTQHYIGLRSMTRAQLDDEGELTASSLNGCSTSATTTVEQTSPAATCSASTDFERGEPSVPSSSSSATNEEDKKEKTELSGVWSSMMVMSDMTRLLPVAAHHRPPIPTPSSQHHHQPQHWSVWMTSSPGLGPPTAASTAPPSPLLPANCQLPSPLASNTVDVQQQQQSPSLFLPLPCCPVEEEEVKSPWDWLPPPAQNHDSEWQQPGSVHLPTAWSPQQAEDDVDYFEFLLAWDKAASDGTTTHNASFSFLSLLYS